MCGITGIAGLNGSIPDLSVIRSMCDTLRHRGPDDEGLEIRDNVAMAMRRLAIIDIEGGQQPVYNELKNIRVMFNGEIYNFRELQSKLESRGHHFKTKSDTEVLVHSYEEYGEEFPLYLNGMFAIALHDLTNKKLIIVRDHIGIKPLFYYLDQKYFIWGSEIKALLASGCIKRELNVDSLGEFLSWEYIPGRGTLYKNINKLEPGHMMVIDLASHSLRHFQYWDIPDQREDIILSEDEWIDAVDDSIKSAVKRQLVSDVPLGAFLSGGVDSSLITSAMGQSRTFSIGFDDPTYNELSWARKVADHLGLNHEDEILSPDIEQLFNDLMFYMDDPIGDFSIFPTFLVSKLARKYVTVSLSGDGGDELFGGYETYIAHDLSKKYEKLPLFLRKLCIESVVNSLKPRQAKKGFVNKAKRFIEGFENQKNLGHARWRLFNGDSFRRELFSKDMINEFSGSSENHIVELYDKAKKRQPLNQSLYVDVKSYLCDNCLVKTDRMSMAVSLEVRVPFLDKDLVELAFRIPDHFKVEKAKTKVLLKKIASKYVPTKCVYRPKEGFSIPIKQWLCSELRPLMEGLLDKTKIKQEGIFNPETVETLKKQHLAGDSNHSHTLWSLMVFESWKSRWFEE